MKRHQSIRENFLVIFISFWISIFFYSCDSYNFASPQPVDKENIYEFPADIRGNWVSENENELIIISRSYASLRNTGKEKIVKGIWPVLNDSGAVIYPPVSYKSFNTIRFDSLQKPIDTIPNYLLDKNNIYEVNEDGKLGKGYQYKLDKDTIILFKNEEVIIDLGRNAFIRKLKNDLYVINIMNSILGQENPWWQITILEKKGNDHLNIWDCNGKLKKHPSMFYTPVKGRGSGNYYFNSKWSTNDILHLMDEGYFEVSNTLKRAK